MRARSRRCRTVSAGRSNAYTSGPTTGTSPTNDTPNRSRVLPRRRPESTHVHANPTSQMQMISSAPGLRRAASGGSTLSSLHRLRTDDRSGTPAPRLQSQVCRDSRVGRAAVGAPVVAKGGRGAKLSSVVLFPLALVWLVVIVVLAIRSRPAEPVVQPDERQGWRRPPRRPRRGPDRAPGGGIALRKARASRRSRVVAADREMRHQGLR
jgi:hypothetical protein